MCLSVAHQTFENYAGGEEEMDVVGRVRAVESAILAFSGSQGGVASRSSRSAEVCRLYNEKRCSFRNCKYRQVCKWCGGSHARCECRSGQSRDRVQSGANLRTGRQRTDHIRLIMRAMLCGQLKECELYGHSTNETEKGGSNIGEG